MSFVISLTFYTLLMDDVNNLFNSWFGMVNSWFGDRLVQPGLVVHDGWAYTTGYVV